MLRLPLRYTRTDTLSPYTTLFRSRNRRRSRKNPYAGLHLPDRFKRHTPATPQVAHKRRILHEPAAKSAFRHTVRLAESFDYGNQPLHAGRRIRITARSCHGQRMEQSSVTVNKNIYACAVFFFKSTSDSHF